MFSSNVRGLRWKRENSADVLGRILVEIGAKIPLLFHSLTDLILPHQDFLYSLFEYYPYQDLSYPSIPSSFSPGVDFKVVLDPMGVLHLQESELGISGSRPCTEKTARWKKKRTIGYTKNCPAVHQFLDIQYTQNECTEVENWVSGSRTQQRSPSRIVLAVHYRKAEGDIADTSTPARAVSTGFENLTSFLKALFSRSRRL